MKVPLIYLTLWSVCNAAAYISRMSSTVNRLRAPSPSPFRPGVSLTQRPWTQRFVQAPSNRQPYVVYRNGPPPQRYPMKHFGPTRMFPSTSWKSTRLSSNPEIDFARAASQTSTIHTNGDSGAIHTIPAPNLSLSEKPIVVIDADAMTTANGVMTDARKSTYEVTEKYVEPSVNLPARYIGMPAGLTETTALIRHNAALQLASELGLQAVALHGHSIPQQNIQPNPFLQQFQQQQLQQQFQQQFQQPHEQLQHQSQLQQPLIPQQFSLQGGFTGQISQQDLLQAGTEGIVIPPSALYQQDPNYLQKLQTQLLQRFPSVEFIPYDTQSQVVQVPVQQNPQPGIQLQQNQQPQASQNEEVVYINNDPIAKQAASGFVSQDAKKNVVQRETQESTLVTLVPQGFVVSNITEAPIEISTAPKAQPSAPAQPQVQIQPQMRPHNVTVHILPADSQPITTTIKYIIETTTEAEKATPVYYPPTQENVVQTATNVITEAQDISDIRVAPAVVEASEKPQDTTTRVNEQVENAMTSTINPDMQNYFSVQNAARTNNNETVTELKPILGIPFAKKADSASVAYTFVRTDEKEPKLTQNGERVFMGQLVEAKITEDHEYNKEKAATFQSRAPLRLFVPQSSTQSNTVPPSTVTPQRTPAIKARIPPRSKLTFDDRTGEPVLRIYASYVDNPTQKEAQTTKQTNIRSRNEISTTKQDNSANWKTSTIKKIDKPQSRDPNRVTNFGLKLRSRSDDYIPLFDEYEE